ncbi:MAG: hypothetical protein ABI204_11380 [Ginsengibacter sp.]
MESIIIEVDEATAKEWQEVSPKIKEQMKEYFKEQIQMFSQGINEARFEALLDKSSDEAEKNGLTEEILQQLMNEE